ncbi:MAG: PIG-L deacetylase family protein [Planctomycetota bacterium]
MKNLLAVAAHPDDESFLFGGTLALHADRGGRAGLLCLTDGQAGRTGGLVERERLPEVRRQELRRAVEVLGIPELYLAGLMDGALDEVGDERGTAIVASHIARFGADVLLTFGPEGASGHADHKACFRWTMAAAGGRPVYVASHPESEPELARGGPPLPVTTVIDISSLGDRKRRAFLEHETQQDHLELYDRIMTAFNGAEYYHRLSPPWREDDPLETSLLQS